MAVVVGDDVVVTCGGIVWQPRSETLTQFQPRQRNLLGSIRVHEKGPGVCRAVVDDPYAESKHRGRVVANRPGLRSDTQRCDREVWNRWTAERCG